MGVYNCQNCSQQIDLKGNFKTGDIFDNDIYKCKNCGTYLSRDELSPEDLDRDNWIQRSQQHNPKVQLRLGVISIFVVFLILAFAIKH